LACFYTIHIFVAESYKRSFMLKNALILLGCLSLTVMEVWAQDSELKDKMVLLPSGSYKMGVIPGTDPDAHSTESPQHTVRINAFYISKYEVTFAEYDAFCSAKGYPRANDEGWGRDQRPVINISWKDAANYCNWLSERERLAAVYTIKGDTILFNLKANGYRLPTEAEWEYAARGGMNSQNTKYAGSNDLDAVGWYEQNSETKTQPIGKKKANELGMYDVTGNVWEWCHDLYDPNFYSVSASDNPSGPVSGEGVRIIRGGGWRSRAQGCRVTARSFWGPNFHAPFIGFRVCRTQGCWEQ
jgi:formylglycine-generating enzyme required for sulfatase activity